MGEKVNIQTGNVPRGKTIKPEKNHIRTAVPIQSPHSHSVGIRKLQIANDKRLSIQKN